MIDFKLKRGMNLDHHVAEPGKYLAQEKYFKAIKEAGFDHVRLPFEFTRAMNITHGLKPPRKWRLTPGFALW